MSEFVYVVIRQADVGSVEVEGAYRDFDKAAQVRDEFNAEDGDAYTSWVVEQEVVV